MNSSRRIAAPIPGPAKLWTMLASARAGLYRNRWLQPRRLNAKVISIGNITWGGTGKTPFTIWLAQRLQANGLRVSILTRGYRRSSRAPVMIVPAGTAADAAADCGDEVQVYLRHLQVPIGICNSRYRAGKLLEEQFPVDVHLLDDGFQHLSLARDLDLVLIDSENPWGSRAGFSALLREAPAALSRADAILLTRCEAEEALETRPQPNAQPVSKLQAQIDSYHPGVACFRVGTRLVAIEGLPASAGLAPSAFFGRRAVAFCGIGNPNSFFDLLKRSEITLAATRVFSDHHRYSNQDMKVLDGIAKDARADCFITTEKDVANLPRAWRPLSALPVYVALIEPRIDDEQRLLHWIGRRIGLPIGAAQDSSSNPSFAEGLNSGVIA